MQPIKMRGLAVLAALLAMALAGPSPAMAEPEFTALCSEDTGSETCPEKQLVEHVHEVTAEGNQARLLSAVEVKCDVLFLSSTTSEAGIPLIIVGHYTYTNCKTSGGSKCEVKETSESSAIAILESGHELAEVTGEGEVNVHCGLFINCNYNSEGLVGHGLGPLLAEKESGEIRIEDQELNTVKGFCPKTAKLDILTVPLEATYLAKGALEMVCIDVGLGNGRYLKYKANSGECLDEDASDRPGRYELGYAASGRALNEATCTWVGANNGYWLSLAWFWYSSCGSWSSDNPLRKGSYELGVVQ